MDQSGNVDGYDDYYPFGLVMPGRSSNSANPTDNYKFTGYEKDNEAGLDIYHANARGYDPVLGRFMQIDDFYDKYPDQSPYNYALNNPMFYTDITGDTVEIAYSKLAGGAAYHVSIIHRDNETGEETNIVEGFPEKRPAEHLAENLATGDWGNLLGYTETEPEKIAAGDREMIPIPEGMTEDEFVKSLEANFASYDNAVTYSPIPKAGEGNSNSLVGSVLRKSGSDFTPSRNTPGFKRNVLPSQDRRSTATKIADNVKGFLGRMQSAIRTASF
ncbi:MAG: RHS repeat-associated core domain-containing protein [Cyanothece sp. SIO1E1]|nr:RHS repeat-associated core domain-containing protein [Cyanothece sp. SIO1E1]